MKFNVTKTTQPGINKKLYYKPELQTEKGRKKNIYGEMAKIPKVASVITGRVQSVYFHRRLRKYS